MDEPKDVKKVTRKDRIENIMNNFDLQDKFSTIISNKKQLDRINARILSTKKELDRLETIKKELLEQNATNDKECRSILSKTFV